MIFTTVFFIVVTINEQTAMASKTGLGTFLFKNNKFPQIPK